MTSKISLYETNEAYHVYVTDSLKVIGGLDKRYVDIRDYVPPKEETRTPEEIINNIKRKLHESI